MAHVRDSARSYGKSDPIDALAVGAGRAAGAGSACRAPSTAWSVSCGLLVDHREELVAERTRITCRLRWHLHELDPDWTAPTKLQRGNAF